MFRYPLSLAFRFVILFSMVSATVGSAAPPRIEIDLGGSWQYQKVSELTTPPEIDASNSSDWKSVQVPSTLLGFDYERVWIQRSFDVPRDAEGQRIRLQFDGVKYNSRVFVNGIHVGGCFNGYDAFEVDVTDAVKWGQPNTLAVGCHDWTGVFSGEGERVDFSKKPGWQRPRRFVVDKVIAPIGGHYDHYGIWGDVRLLICDPIHVSDLFVRTSVRNQEMVIRYQVTNDSEQDAEVTLQPIVEEQGEDLFAIPAETIVVPAGETKQVTCRRAWKGARYWSHEDPWLYHLRTELSTGDVMRTRFGFKEFWIEGHRYVLNGKKVNLLATSWWPPTDPIDRDEVVKRWKALKAAGVNCFRTHTQPWRRVHYDVADELGLLMIVEGAMWHDPGCTAYHDPTYWGNFETMIRAMIHREKNRASVIMWSMENESYSGREKTELALKHLPHAGRMAKQQDPTRPVYFESDGDPGGVADAIGLHYVHEYPKYNCWPNEAYWLDKPFRANSWYINDKELFQWKKKKPFYMGEFLWAPAGTPAPHTIFYGDDAYRDLDHYTLLAKAMVWNMQILAFRHQEAGGISPWTVGADDLTDHNPLYRSHRYAYQPIAAYCLDYDHRFFGGSTLQRRLSIFNDVMTDSKLQLQWKIHRQGKVLQKYSRDIPMEAGERVSMTMDLALPEVDQRTPVQWTVTLTRDGKQEFSETHDYAVFPVLTISPPQSRIGLFDPLGSSNGASSSEGSSNEGSTTAQMKRLAIPFVAIENLADIPADVEVLIVGTEAFSQTEEFHAFTIGRVDPVRSAVTDFMKRGGRMLVLKQQAYPAGLFDVGLTSQESTMTHALRPSHPAMNGVDPEDLKYWRGNNHVTAKELGRPTSGATVSIVASGSKAGLANVALLEHPVDRGTVVHSQLLLTEKMETEPTAGVVFRNLLNYLDSFQTQQGKTLVVGGNDAYRNHLRDKLQMDLQERDMDNFADLADVSLIIGRGDLKLNGTSAPRLKQFVQTGGNLLVHRPTPETFDQIANLFDLGLEFQVISGSVTKTDHKSRFSEAITREDLYWSKKLDGVAWARQPMSQQMIDGFVGQKFSTDGLTKHKLNTWKTAGGYVVPYDWGVMFASPGSASGEIEFPESGLVSIGILAKGTPCQGEYPIAQISVDGSLLGSVQIHSQDYQTYGLVANVQQGSHQVKLEFVNDGSDSASGEDRNLFVQSLVVGKSQAMNEKVHLITVPSALVEIEQGSGRIVIDCIRWDTEQENAQKAASHASSMLTFLGGRFASQVSAVLETESMTPNEGIHYFNVQGGITYMGSNGTLSSGIQVAKSGTYDAELVAAGDSSEGIFPLVEIWVDHEKRMDIQLTTGGWKNYPMELELTQGSHHLQLKFVNDHSSSTGDRNLHLDKWIFDTVK